MPWIKTTPYSKAEGKLKEAYENQRPLYPQEYGSTTAASLFEMVENGESIVASHSLIPDALYHAFATFGVLMSPDLPLSRRQHEMIATLVSVLNSCFW